MMQFNLRKVGWLLRAIAALSSMPAHAVVVSVNQLEVVTVSSVGNTFQTVNLENTYTNAIPVCTYNMPSVPPVNGAPIPAVVRIDAITATSFDVKIQRAATSGTETAGDVHCIISETGDFNVGGLHWEAGSHTPNVTSARSNFGVKAADVVTPLVGGFTSPVVISQVISHNDANWSTTWAYAGSAGAPPTAANIHVGKHIAHDTVNTTRADEDVGYIIVETGSGTVNGVANERALGVDTLIGVTSGAVNYSLSRNYQHGIASQNAMDGGDGGWAVLLGPTPLAGTTMALAIDEDTIGDTERAHTTEQAAYWAFEPVTVADLGVLLTDGGSTTYVPGTTVVYTVVLSNSGVNDSTSATLSFPEPAGVMFTSWTCVASGTASCLNGGGVGSISETSTNLPVGETLTFTVNAAVNSNRTGNLVATATSSSATFTDNVASNNSASDTNTQNSMIDIEVSNDDGSAIYVAGTTVVYTMSATNNGPSDASNVNVVNAVPVGTTISSWTCVGASCPAANGAGAINETAATLTSGDSLVYTVNVAVPPSMMVNLVSTASASATETDTDGTNDSATDTDTPTSLIDLVVTNDDGATIFVSGSTLVYTLTVSNTGPSNATNVNVVNAIPAGTTISSWTCAGASCPAANGSGAINETAATLVPGDSLIYTVNVDVPVGLATTIDNTASATAAEPESDNTNNTATDSNLPLIDADGDGILDVIEIGPDINNPIDTDNDGVPDYLENNNTDTDGDGNTNQVDVDDDGDGLLTIDELGAGGGLNPADSDGDGVADYLSASKIQTGVDGGAGSLAWFVWLIAIIKLLEKTIIRRHIKCSTGYCKRYC